MRNYTMFEIERFVPNFFSKEAKRFFNSKINMQQNAKHGFFITSEKFDENSDRLFSIRHFGFSSVGNPTINTVSEFQEFSSLGQSKKEFDKIVKLIDVIEKSGGFLESEILKKMHYITKENGLYFIYAFIDEKHEEEKVLKLDTKNMRYTF